MGLVISVPNAPKTREIELVEGRVGELVGKVRVYDQDIRRFEEHIGLLKEEIEAMVGETEACRKVRDLSEQLKRAQAELKQALADVPGYNDLMEQLADEQESLKDAKASISTFLLGYFAETRERQIELDEKHSREVKLKASLGREQPYQTSLLARAADDEPS